MVQVQLEMLVVEVAESRVIAAPLANVHEESSVVPTGRKSQFVLELEMPCFPASGMGLVLDQRGSAVTVGTVAWDTIRGIAVANTMVGVKPGDYEAVCEEFRLMGATEVLSASAASEDHPQ